MNFIDQIKGRAKAERKRIVFPESLETRVLQAARILHDEQIVDPVLVGIRSEILTAAGEAGVDLSGIEMVEHLSHPAMQNYLSIYCELRRHKKICIEEAAAKLMDPVFFAAMMVREGVVDGSVCGAVTTTAKTVTAALQIIGTARGIKTLSSHFIMVHPDPKWGTNGVLLYSDAGVVPDPDENALAEIAITSAHSFRTLVQSEPIIAMLSFSTKGSARHATTKKVIEGTRLAWKMAPQLILDGELQGDAALVPMVCERKAPGSPVAGKANVLIFPNLDAGNIAYKLTQRLASAVAFGPILQGLARPANDLSRGCSTEDIVTVAAITAVQAQAGAIQIESLQ